jgi:hypothetical protein
MASLEAAVSGVNGRVASLCRRNDDLAAERAALHAELALERAARGEERAAADALRRRLGELEEARAAAGGEEGGQGEVHRLKEVRG